SPASAETYLADINESGAATGFWPDQSDVYHGLLYADGICHSVDAPPGPHGYTNTTLTGINNIAEIVGVSFAAAPGDGDGFVLTPHSSSSGSGTVVPGPAIPCAVPRF